MDDSLLTGWGLKTPSDLASLSSDDSSGYLVSGWIPRRRIILTVGDSGLGKSSLMYQLGLAVAAGVPSVLGRAVEGGRVLYLDGENGLTEMASTTSSLIKHLGITTDLPNFLTLSLNDTGPRWSQPSALTQLVKSVNPVLVIIDTVSTFWPGIEEKNADASKKYSELRALISLTGCSFILVHHLKKIPDDGRIPLEDSPNPRSWFAAVRGASALVNNADVRLGVDLPSGSSIRSKAVELVIGGFGRVRGTIPLTYLSRVRDDDGEPLGYSVVSDLDLFSPEIRDLYSALPPTFTFKTARLLTGRPNSFLYSALGDLKSSSLISQPVSRGPYYKS
jgi:hypothetical protein